MKSRLYLIFLVIMTSSAVSSKSQSISYFFEGEPLDSIDNKLNWYEITNEFKLKKLSPSIRYSDDMERGWEGNTITANWTYSIVIFSSSSKLENKSFEKIKGAIRILNSAEKIKLTPEYYLSVEENEIENDQILSLYIEKITENTKDEIFRNCRIIDSITTYFGCGRTPFFLEFIGDINGNGFPEIILGADKEAGALKLIIGYQNGEYKIVKWTEFE